MTKREMSAKRKNRKMAALGRKGGSVLSDSKLASNKRNAQSAGRKPKFSVGDEVLVKDAAPGDYRGRRGRIAERGPGRAEYKVMFTDDPREGYLMSWWLDPA